jgi:hypothetical protein
LKYGMKKRNFKKTMVGGLKMLILIMIIIEDHIDCHHKRNKKAPTRR